MESWCNWGSSIVCYAACHQNSAHGDRLPHRGTKSCYNSKAFIIITANMEMGSSQSECVLEAAAVTMNTLVPGSWGSQRLLRAGAMVPETWALEGSSSNSPTSISIFWRLPYQQNTDSDLINQNKGIRKKGLAYSQSLRFSPLKVIILGTLPVSRILRGQMHDFWWKNGSSKIILDF